MMPNDTDLAVNWSIDGGVNFVNLINGEKLSKVGMQRLAKWMGLPDLFTTTQAGTFKTGLFTDATVAKVANAEAVKGPPRLGHALVVSRGNMVPPASEAKSDLCGSSHATPADGVFGGLMLAGLFDGTIGGGELGAWICSGGLTLP